MSSSNTKSIEITLSRPSDWESWSHKFKAKAMASRLWSHIDPDQDSPLLELPQMPQLTRYPRRTPSADPLTQGVEAGAEPVIEPAAPMSAMDLTDAGRAALQLDMQFFIQNEKRFREQDAAVQKLKDWVTDTVARHYLDVACPAEGTLAIWFKNLKQELGIDDEQSKRKARQRYHAAIKKLEQAKEWERWLENWEKAISQAKEKKVPETLDTFGWVDDFLEAVRPIVGPWSSSYRMITKDTKLLTFRDLSNAFRDEVERLYPSGKGKMLKVAPGSFGPSFAGQEDPDQGAAGDAQNEGAEEASETQRKRRPSKRKRSKDDICAACGLEHSFSDCFYAFPEIAPDWFRPRRDLTEKVKEKFDNDKSLRKRHGEVLKEREAKRPRKE